MSIIYNGTEVLEVRNSNGSRINKVVYNGETVFIDRDNFVEEYGLIANLNYIKIYFENIPRNEPMFYLDIHTLIDNELKGSVAMPFSYNSPNSSASITMIPSSKDLSILFSRQEIGYELLGMNLADTVTVYDTLVFTLKFINKTSTTTRSFITISAV